ncbi:MAG: ABC transporter permease [Methanomassiliicoccales archaeon]|nr:MAG: ABC transporter permease [Methanomassiliicoccales archaeon]
MGVGDTLRHSFWIAWKDLLDLWRNRMAVVMLVLMPLFMMVMVGFIFPTQGSLDYAPIGVANDDEGTVGDAFVQQLTLFGDQTGMMDIEDRAGFEDIKAGILEGELFGGIIIPSNFSSNLESGTQGIIEIVSDQSNPQISLMLQGVLTSVIEEMGTLNATFVVSDRFEVPLDEAQAIVKPYTVQTRGIVPGETSYFDFIAPGIMAMTVMMSVMTGLPHAISHEKEFGTLDGMMVSPINRLAIILGKTIAQTSRGLIQGLLILVLAIAIFGVTIQGSILLLLFLLVLGVFSFVGLGIVITSFAKDEQTATMVMMTLMFPMMFLSGVFFPIQQMPEFMQYIAWALPLTYATSALRKVMVLGADIQSISTEIIVLIIFGAVLLAIAVPMFKSAMKR